MKIHEITEGIASDIVKGAAQLAPKLASSTPHVLELFQRQRASLAQLSKLANPRDLPTAIQRLKALHSDLYDIAYYNRANPQLVARVLQLRDDLLGIITHSLQSANQPMTAGPLLQSLRNELVPVLTRKLSELEQLVKAAPG
jgi:hypothetical protein